MRGEVRRREEKRKIKSRGDEERGGMRGQRGSGRKG
jgi:hypothetical protein